MDSNVKHPQKGSNLIKSKHSQAWSLASHVGHGGRYVYIDNDMRGEDSLCEPTPFHILLALYSSRKISCLYFNLSLEIIKSHCADARGVDLLREKRFYGRSNIAKFIKCNQSTPWCNRREIGGLVTQKLSSSWHQKASSQCAAKFMNHNWKPVISKQKMMLLISLFQVFVITSSRHAHLQYLRLPMQNSGCQSGGVITCVLPNIVMEHKTLQWRSFEQDV